LCEAATTVKSEASTGEEQGDATRAEDAPSSMARVGAGRSPNSPTLKEGKRKLTMLSRLRPIIRMSAEENKDGRSLSAEFDTEVLAAVP
jgi:hypothetical protein